MGDTPSPAAGEGAHVRWDEMAVGHVLGGLDDIDRAIFREHLAACSDCRGRVAELRAMATELERTAEMSDHPSARRNQDAVDVDRRDPPRWFEFRDWRERRAGIVTLLAMVIGLAGVLWLVGQAGRDSELLATVRVQEATLEALGSGSPATMTLFEGVRGVVVSSETDVAWSLTNLPALASEERLVIWFTALDREPDDAGAPVIRTSLLVFRGDQLSNGRLAGSIVDGATSEVRVTIETFPLPEGPTGPELLRADLTGDR